MVDLSNRLGEKINLLLIEESIFHGRKKELGRVSSSACQCAPVGVIMCVSDVSDESESENYCG